jgi:hypothetical protein
MILFFDERCVGAAIFMVHSRRARQALYSSQSLARRSVAGDGVVAGPAGSLTGISSGVCPGNS